MKIFFICDPQLNDDGVSHAPRHHLAHMHLDTTFGVKIAAVCAALGWRVRDWDFFFGPYDAGHWRPVGLRKYATPRDFELDDTDEVEILCVPALSHN
jgi:hypothetical protein